MRQRLWLTGVGAFLALGMSVIAVLITRQAGLEAAAEPAGVISGVVTSGKGPEAGVWVIAETGDLPTRFRKIVVTNDQGKFLLPELPMANYSVWVRGYGLVDSKAVASTPGRKLKLTAVVARTPQEAARVYPANYWLSLMEPPKDSEFSAAGPKKGTGISPQLHSHSEFMDNLKACLRCHQIGNQFTRQIPDPEGFASTAAAWDHRIQRGQRGTEMSSFMTRLGRDRGLQMFASWSDRITAGETPAAPPRPKGIERNVVLTEWDWSDDKGFVHDEVSTDRRNPRVNAGGNVYGTDWGRDYLTITDPMRHSSRILKVPRRETPPANAAAPTFQPYRFFGMDPVHTNPANPHNPMMDAKGRVWITTSIRSAPNPAWCKEGSALKFAQYFPQAASGHHAGYFDPRTETFVLIDTCFGTHHLQFGEDANDTLYFSSPGGAVIGWIETKKYDQTGDEKASQGWCPTVLDTNGDGRITKPWNEPIPGRASAFEEDQESIKAGRGDPTLDTRVVVGSYGLIVSPVDGAVWGTAESYPGVIVRLSPGANPPDTCISEIYEVPNELQGFKGEQAGFRPRGIDVDRDGVIWTALAGTDHFASFDRRKCKILNGPATVRGRHCRDGWTLYPMAGPTFKGSSVRTDYLYYNWVDQFITLGVGPNIPIATGSYSDSLIVLKPNTREWITMRVPYPLGFHARGMDGRIDDPNGGWKGRGVYATNGSNAIWHTEAGPGTGGAGARPTLVKFQIRPDPLAR